MLHQVLAGVLLELGHSDPPVAGLDQLGLHALHANDVAREGDLERLRLALPQDGEADVRFGLAAHALDRLVQAHALDRGVVDLDDEIPGLQPGAKCRRVLDRRHDLDEPFFHADLDAEAAELALRAHLELAERVLVQISGVWIEPGQHAADRFRDELLVLHRLDVARFDRAEHFGEGAQLIDRKRETRRFALRHRGEVQAEQDSCQHADQHQAGLSNVGPGPCAGRLASLSLTSRTPSAWDQRPFLHVESRSIDPIPCCRRLLLRSQPRPPFAPARRPA